MMRTRFAVMAFTAALATAALPVFAQTAAPAPVAGRLTVTGKGVVNRAPDMALISLGVTTEADTAKAALSLNNDQQHAVLKSLSDAGVAGRDVQTSGLTLSPVYSNQNSRDGHPRIRAYQASNMVTVRVRALDDLGALLDTVVTTGANQLNSISFTFADPKPALDEARRRAVADAARKAKLYAEAAGVKLGQIVRFAEAGARPAPQQTFRRTAAMAAEVPIAGGEVSVSAQVTITYALEQ